MEGGGGEGGNWNGLSDEVLVMIFQHLPVADLFSCSVMSKKWKRAARDVLKRSRECYAHINYFHRDLQDLNQMIDSTNIMEMINGLHIRNEFSRKENRESDPALWHSRHGAAVERIRHRQLEAAGQTLEEAKQKVLSVLCGQWRYLDLDISPEPMRYKPSVVERILLKMVILSTADTLEKLVIGQCNDWYFIPLYRAKPFLKLKVFQAQQDRILTYLLDNSLSMFAPNLEKITGVMMKLYEYTLQPRIRNTFVLERMKNVVVVDVFNVPRGEERELFLCVSGLHRLDLQHNYIPYQDDHGNLAPFHSFVFSFVLRSLNTLKELRMYARELYKLLMASDELTFPNLQRLALATHAGELMANEILALKKLKFPKLFPSLEQLELSLTDYSYQDEEVEVPFDEPDCLDQSDLPVAVDLICRDGLYNNEHLEFAKTIYPKLSKVRILELKNVDDYEMSKIFEDLQSLEYLEINVLTPQYEVEFGIEALLSGINVEEVYLQCSLAVSLVEDKLNSSIVPIRPSLLNAKCLKELKITEVVSEGVRTVRSSWVTQVTENLPERHVRNMTVTFDGSKGLYDRLNHMRTFTWLQANKIKS